MNENTKLLAGIIAAGSIGSFGGHTVGSADETIVNASTLESCKEFIIHAREHERLLCEDDKIKLFIDCK